MNKKYKSLSPVQRSIDEEPCEFCGDFVSECDCQIYAIMEWKDLKKIYENSKILYDLLMNSKINITSEIKKSLSELEKSFNKYENT